MKNLPNSFQPKSFDSSGRHRFNLRVFGGSSHPELTRQVARKVGVRVGEARNVHVIMRGFCSNVLPVQVSKWDFKLIRIFLQTSRLSKFANKETGVELLENVRGQASNDVHIHCTW